MKRCAYLTLEDPTGFFIYDTLTYEPLARLGWAVESIPWNRSGVRWDDYDLVVIRSAWDYQRDVGGFLNVLGTIDRSSARLENPLPIVRWNLEKTYLRDLEKRGVLIVPTRWLRGLKHGHIAAVCHEHAAVEAIVKPTVGANADDTFRLPADASPADTREVLRLFRDRPLMLQPFLPEIIETGEHSLFYFGGQYSHCVLKTPGAGDFRVQEEHGGRIRAVTPEEDLLAAGRQVIDAVGRVLLYARVDLVRLQDGQPALMELELIEPSLYFNYDSASSERFAQAVGSLA